ncbi:hypothetical protein CEXT_506311 [Caerostris extrusa]|uniref:Uncharacterized protein n=1 Tax=Caerostris extrusa TaxID=172846 RepID=A0AAV4W3M9_CAEEX|nr:hypothetical protein CEXT_506311 [Caerostris extrusa]
MVFNDSRHPLRATSQLLPNPGRECRLLDVNGIIESVKIDFRNSELASLTSAFSGGMGERHDKSVGWKSPGNVGNVHWGIGITHSRGDLWQS